MLSTQLARIFLVLAILSSVCSAASDDSAIIALSGVSGNENSGSAGGARQALTVKEIYQLLRFSTPVSPDKSSETLFDRTLTQIVGPRLEPLGLSPVPDYTAKLSASNGYGGEKWCISYRVKYQGIMIAPPSGLVATLYGNGESILLRERNMPDQRRLQSLILPKQDELSLDTAIEFSRALFLNTTGTPGKLSPTANPPRLEICYDAGETSAAKLTWLIGLRDASGLHAYEFWVAVGPGPKLVQSRNMISHADGEPLRGSVDGSIWTEAGPPSGDTVFAPLRNLFVTSDSPYRQTTTHQDGKFEIAYDKGAKIDAKLDGGILFNS